MFAKSSRVSVSCLPNCCSSMRWKTMRPMSMHSVSPHSRMRVAAMGPNCWLASSRKPSRSCAPVTCDEDFFSCSLIFATVWSSASLRYMYACGW